MTLFERLQQLMLDYRFRPSQKFGQNFIINDLVLEKMVAASELKKEDVVLEIGCGTGFLTELLLEKSNVIGLEVDSSLIDLLNEKFSNHKNFTLLEKSVLDAPESGYNKVVSLPPYNLSTEIMLKIISSEAELVVLTLQREFVEKLKAFPSLKEYGHLSVLTNLFFEPFVIMKEISPKSFYPKPETFSSIIILKRKAPKPPNLHLLVSFTKHLFRLKNKNVLNSLKKCLNEMNVNKEKDLEKIVQDLELEEVKTNTLEPREVLALFKRIFPE